MTEEIHASLLTKSNSYNNEKACEFIGKALFQGKEYMVLQNAFDELDEISSYWREQAIDRAARNKACIQEFEKTPHLLRNNPYRFTKCHSSDIIW